MNPDPLDVWNEACERSQVAWYEIGEQPNDPEGDAQAKLTNEAAAAVIAQHYAPLVAEVERLREAASQARLAAAMLIANAEGCIANHYALDFEQQGEPGWLSDARRDIDALSQVLGEKS